MRELRPFAAAYAGNLRSLEAPVRRMMEAMGKAMWGMAQLKECVWYGGGLQGVTNFFHWLEHSYGDRIDELKSTLAQVGLPVIYPQFQALNNYPATIDKAFDLGIELIDEVNAAVSDFVEQTDNAYHEPLARQAENIQIANYKPRAYMTQAREMALDGNSSSTSFDSWFVNILKAPQQE